ncbi:MAG: GAF domain-containing protein [Leptolyngbyaceae cyanobacterium SM2_5_2]|nr:GAF domain-containing protein [Leptolyngbyaceae cyanobacterium SM2_5_2]
MPSHFFSNGGACSLDRPVASWPRCRLPQPSTSQQEQQRLTAIADLNLESNRSIPAFEEAIQLAANFVGASVGWVSVVNATHETLKATYGLSVLGVGNGLAEQRQLPLEAGIGPYVLSGEEPVVIPDLTQLPTLAQADLVTTYGIVACCAVPLVAAQQCIGVLAVLDVRPRSFSQRDIGFLAMAARWGMAEYERTLAAAALKSHWPVERPLSNDTIRLGLIGQLVQDLRNPLTTVLGMTTMLSHEIYGPLTEKQREYIDIVRSSSQTLMTQVDEMAHLGVAHLEAAELVPTSVDIGRLGEQVRATLAPWRINLPTAWN